tara:strand:+ start:484 stop:1374 length:891 start_codon:yes stop_codon:yes gene_type:complete
MVNNNNSYGKIIFLTIPIGNLGDITLNVLNCLKGPGNFAVEDSRSFKKLLGLLECNLSGKNIYSFHDQSDKRAIETFVSILKKGEDVFICSEAGSPCISDPGVGFLKSVQAELSMVKVYSHGGVSSVHSALENSGVLFNRYCYWGFSPRSNTERLNLLQKMSAIGGAHVIFESPHRIKETLNFIKEYGGSVSPDEIFVCRELTKKYQEITKLHKYSMFSEMEKITIKGEFVFVFNYLNSNVSLKNMVNGVDLSSLIDRVMSDKVNLKDISKLIAAYSGIKSKTVYNLLSKKFTKLS